MNSLVEYLRTNGHFGRGKAIFRAKVAAALVVSIREIRALAEEARNAGIFVSYSTDGANGGLFIAESEAEQILIISQIRTSCLNRLRQYSALKRTFRNRNQRNLFPETVDDVFRRGGQR